MKQQFLYFIIAILLSVKSATAQNFTVQAAAFADSVSSSYFADRGVVDVRVERGSNGFYKYFVGNYALREQAETVKQLLVERGFNYASIVDLEAQRALSDAHCGYYTGLAVLRQFEDPDSPVRVIYFEKDKTTLSAQARSELDRFYVKMKADPALILRVMGFNDSEAEAEESQRLSAERARSARNYLISKGIRADRMIIEAYGESDPLVPNKDMDGKLIEENLPLNRRVMLKFAEPH